MRLNYIEHKEEIRDVLYEAQHGQCVGCLDVFPKRNHELDHIEPQADGGSDHISNIQLLCSTCNRSKSRKSQAEFLAQTAHLRVGKTPLFSNIDYSALERRGVDIIKHKEWDKRASKPMTKKEAEGWLVIIVVVVGVFLYAFSSCGDYLDERNKVKQQQKQLETNKKMEKIRRERELEQMEMNRLKAENQAEIDKKNKESLDRVDKRFEGYIWVEGKGYIKDN